MSRTLQLTKGKEAIVDDADFEMLSAYKWFFQKNGKTGVARASVPAGKNRQTKVVMHRLLLGARRGQWVDHINGNPLDNRRSNLRFCSPRESARNRGPFGGRSPFKGVAWSKANRKWKASICVGDSGERLHLGYFKDAVFAASAYNEAALKHHGDFARTNEYV